MKKLILILLFSTVMFSSSSYAEWTKVVKNVDGDTYYVDFERIRKHGGNVYYWSLADFSKPSPWNDLSAIVYSQGDCKLYRRKILDWTFYKKPMGRGDGNKEKITDKWDSAPPNSILKITLKSVCAYAK